MYIYIYIYIYNIYICVCLCMCVCVCVCTCVRVYVYITSLEQLLSVSILAKSFHLSLFKLFKNDHFITRCVLFQICNRASRELALRNFIS